MFEVDSSMAPEELADRLAYWEDVIDGVRQPTTQVLREATTTINGGGVSLRDLAARLPFGDGAPLPNRRCLRYGPHGIHDYRGKFFPQLVRALLNIGDVPPQGVVADPMCGSGTTAVETVLSARTALGLDLNPLSVLLSRTKTALLAADPSRIQIACARVEEWIADGRLPRKHASHFNSLTPPDQDYLRRWLSQPALAELDRIATVIALVGDACVRDFLRVVLSNIIRSVSWQKPDDLRVRKEVRSAEPEVATAFLREMKRSVFAVCALLYQNRGAKLGKWRIDEGDARAALAYWGAWRRKVDCIITSPPYATALPYIDTDRLSLSFLDLLSRSAHRARDAQMIGNREVTERARRLYWEEFRRRTTNLPTSVVRLIERIEAANAEAGVGFRRRNLPALLARYFFDMLDVLGVFTEILRPGANVFVVIGNNHTIAGGRRVEIETDELMAELGERVGLKLVRKLGMEMLISRDIFRSNSCPSESILHFTWRQS